MLRRISVVLAIASLAADAGAQQSAPKTDRFAQLRFLVGTWRGDQAGQPGHGTAERTYQFILNDRFLQETNTSTYAPQEKNKSGEVHHHMSMISYDAARKRTIRAAHRRLRRYTSSGTSALPAAAHSPTRRSFRSGAGPHTG
jgi:hypothetical protein